MSTAKFTMMIILSIAASSACIFALYYSFLANMLGRIAHFTADAVLLSAVLAGIRRNTGLEPATGKIENEEIRKYVDKYLNLGEWVVDSSVVFMNNSSYFERKK